jgi:FHS family L-fucose permease-like MFS transporter
VWLHRKRLVETPAARTPLAHMFNLLKRPRFGLGALCIFLYVGAEVAIGSLIVNYLMQTNVLGLGGEDAGKHVTYYWGGAMVGRFIGAALLRRFPPANVLACAILATIILLALSGLSAGPISGMALIAIGLFNSIMFPTIFSLASEGLGARAAEGSGLICMAIVGGAIIPPLTGLAADAATLRAALFVPAICYLGIAAFALYCKAHPQPLAADEPPLAPVEV